MHIVLKEHEFFVLCIGVVFSSFGVFFGSGDFDVGADIMISEGVCEPTSGSKSYKRIVDSEFVCGVF